MNTFNSLNFPILMHKTKELMRFSFFYFGKNIRNCVPQLHEFLENGGRIEVVFPDPEKEELMKELGKKMGWKFPSALTPKNKIDTSLDMLDHLKHKDQIHVRLVPKLPNYSMYIFDETVIISIFQESTGEHNVVSPVWTHNDAQSRKFFNEEFNVLWNLEKTIEHSARNGE